MKVLRNCPDRSASLTPTKVARLEARRNASILTSTPGREFSGAKKLYVPLRISNAATVEYAKRVQILPSLRLSWAVHYSRRIQRN